MRYTTLFIFFLLLLGFDVKRAEASEISLQVRNIKTAGEIHIAVYQDEDTYKKIMEGDLDMGEESTYTLAEKVEEGSSNYRFNLPDGQYGIVIYVDANLNNELDFSVFGMPSEQFGFSNNARGVFGPPQYKDILFSVKGDTSLTIDLI